MTQVFRDDGSVCPVTVVTAGPCVVLQVKRSDSKDGYDAIQLGYEDIKPSKATKPAIGHAARANTTP